MLGPLKLAILAFLMLTASGLLLEFNFHYGISWFFSSIFSFFISIENEVEYIRSGL